MALFSRLAIIFHEASRNTENRVLFVSSYARELCDMFLESAPGVTNVDFVHTTGVPAQLLEGTIKYSVLVYDHTTLGGGLQQILEAAFASGVKIVEGLLWYTPAAEYGWTGVYGDEKILVSHTEDGLNIGPADDPTRVVHYSKYAYAMFTHPSLLKRGAAKFYYEFKLRGSMGQYTAYNVGDAPVERVKFRLPFSTDPDLIVVAVDRRFATGVFASETPDSREGGITNTNAAPFGRHRDYFFQVRRKLFEDAVLFLVGKAKGSDLMTEAIRYITAHNYSDLFEGSRVISAYSSSYTDGLCLAAVCALQAYTLRYKLTRESMRTLMDAKYQANLRLGSAPLGALGKLTVALLRYAKYAVVDATVDAVTYARKFFTSTDLIPGVFYDVYVDRTYEVGGDWVRSEPRHYVQPDDVPVLDLDDPVTDFLGGVVDTSAASYLVDVDSAATLTEHVPQDEPYKFNLISEPVKKFQDVYDEVFPGNSVANLANIAELRKSRDLDMRVDFVGRVQVNMDVRKTENLHADMPVRTAALPVGRSGLVDAILASAKRNFSAPDIHSVSDVFAFSKRLVDEFISRACVPGAKGLCAQYRAQPLTFNVTSYCEWAAGKSEAYRNALLGEMPDEIMALGLNKYTTILKGRIKPKLSVTAQLELGQPQVVVHQTKKETAMFSAVFRRIFTRFDSLLKDEYKSAGQSSDADITAWATKNKAALLDSVLLEGDSSMYDKSQGLLAMMIQVTLMQELGCSVEVIELLKNTFVGGVTAASAGLMFVLALQRKSGHGDTMIGNIIYNAVSIGHCIGWDRIRACVLKGDDNLIALYKNTFAGADASAVAAKMGLYFNLETKVILHEVPGFSSGGFVPLGEQLLFFPDPVKLLELLGEKQIDPSLTMKEQFVSYCDRVSAYRASGAPYAIAQWVHRRYKTNADIVGLVDAFLTLAGDYQLFSHIKDPSPNG